MRSIASRIAIVLFFAFLLYTPALKIMAAAPVCFPGSVMSEADLNAAIACYNSLVAPGTYDINIGVDILLTASTPSINNPTAGVNLVINGDHFAVDGQSISGVRVFKIAANTTVEMKSLTVRNGKVVNTNGAGIFNEGTLTLTDSTVSGNAASIGIGSIDPTSGGGIYNATGTLTLTDSTVSGNTVTRTGNIGPLAGGGIYNVSGALTLTNSTVSGNTVASSYKGSLEGGGIYNGSGPLTLTNSTISANNVTRFDNVGNVAGGGIYNVSGALAITNSAVSNNSASSTSGSVQAGGIYTGGTSLTITNSTVSDNSASRYYASGGSLEGGGIVITNGISTLTNTIVTGNTAFTGAGHTTALGGGIFNGSFLTITNSLVSGNNATGGGASAGGGAIYNTSTLTITNSTVSGNNTTTDGYGSAARGGGIYNSGSVSLTNSTVSGNTASFAYFVVAGGGIFNIGTVSLTNSTLSSNTAGSSDSPGSGGGGIASTGQIIINFSTLYKNSATPNGGVTAGGGINILSGTVEIKNSIVAHTGSEEGDDCKNAAGTLTSIGDNIGSDGSCTGFSLLNTDPNLADLALNSGTTQTHLPNPGSPAINGVATCTDTSNAAVTADQRGLLRPQSSGCDIGSVEIALVSPVCFPDPVMNEAELNAAIVCYNSIVDPGTYDINIGANILLTASTTPINNATAGVNLVINGGGFAVDGQNISGVRVFNIATSTTVEMKSLIVRNGKLAGNGSTGAGILNNGILTLTNIIVSGNTVSIAAGGFVAGGGIYNNNGTLTLTDSTVSGNTVSRTANVGAIAGGGIYNLSGTLTLTNSAVSGNTVSAIAGTVQGGGIYNGYGTLTLTNSTVSDNTASKENASGGIAQGGGILMNSGTGTLTNSTVSDNTVATYANNSNAQGGGIFNGSTSLVLTNSTVSGNIANSAFGTSARGGGIFNSGTNLTLTNSTVSGNIAMTGGISARGGGIYNDAGTTTLTNSTVSSNTASSGIFAYGGGIGNTGELIINFSTFYKNSADLGGNPGEGGGINILSGTAQINNSIIAHTAFEQGDDCTIGGVLTATGDNIGGDGSCTGFSLLNTNPNLAALALNGGPTQTHLPNPGSPAINGVTGTCPASDQRGIARPQDTLCDIGSVEVTGAAPVTRIVIEKQTYPAGDPTEFQFTGEIVALLNDNETAQKDVTPGQYTVSEIVPAGWDLTDVVCDDANSIASLASASVSISVEEGETVTCTFTNSRQGLGMLVIQKETLPDGDMTNFTFQPSYGGEFVLRDGSSYSSGLRPANTIYTFTEIVPAGWDLTSVVCDDSNSTVSLATASANINLQAEETVTCTFTNTKRGTITVVKDADLADGTDFTVVLGGAASENMVLDDAAVDDADGVPNSKTLVLVPGSYTLTELLPSGWNLADVTCQTTDQNQPVDETNNIATIDLGAGEAVTCTFINQHIAPKGKIILVKDAQPNDAQDFTFTTTIPGYSTVTLDDDDDVALSNTAMFSVVPGTYNIAEGVASGWTLSGSGCDDGSETSAINVAADETVTCTFINTKNVITTGSITVKKVTGPGPYVSTGYDFQFYFNSFNFQLDTDETALDKPSNRTFANLQPTTYTLKETRLPANWYLKQITCVANDQIILDHTNTLMGQETQQFSIPLSAGQDVVCTITNWKRGDIQVRKFEDLNANGQHNNGEPWLPGWTFTVYQNGIQIGESYTSNDNGKVNINNLIPGVYQICETPQAGWNPIDCVNATVVPIDRIKVDMPNTRAALPPADDDGDGVPNDADLCALGDDNVDTDADGTTDACDSTPTGDSDSDGVDNALDLCALGDDNVDTDADGTADACDSTPTGDSDSDGVDNALELCTLGDDNLDTDADGIADACDSTPTGDNDSDGVDNAADLCTLGDDNVDTDADGTADACDSTPTGDSDSDGVDNALDLCTLGDDNVDIDADGTADACDSTPTGDNDSDGVDNAVDPTPNGEVTTP